MARNKSPVSATHPHLMKEWNFEKNNIRPESVSYGSHKKIFWVCYVCNHKWKATLSGRTRLKSKCPACAGSVVSDKNRLSKVSPELLIEWNYVKNSLKPEEVSYGTRKRVK